MIEFILVVCMHFVCYVSDDYSIVQMPIEHPFAHPDETDRYSEGGITIIAVPTDREV